MRTTSISILAALALAATAPLSSAAIGISNFLLTSNSVTFDLNGTFPNPLPAGEKNVLFFVNPNPAASPGFALGNFLDSNTALFTGSQALRTSFPPIATGNPSFGDYFYVAFSNNFAVGEAITGTVTANWTNAAFDPAAVTSLNVYWGYDPSLPISPATQPSAITGGTLLTTAPVPEPSTAALLLAGGALALGIHRLRRRS